MSYTLDYQVAYFVAIGDRLDFDVSIKCGYHLPSFRRHCGSFYFFVHVNLKHAFIELGVRDNGEASPSNFNATPS